MVGEQKLQPIPQPPGLPIVGNINDIDPELPLLSVMNLADQYGEIFKLSLMGKERMIYTTVALLNEVCDEKRFNKAIAGPLQQVRNGTGGKLLSQPIAEHIASRVVRFCSLIDTRILVPAFGPMSIRNMFDDMKDIASQLVLKWARHGPEYRIPVTDDFTRLTLDTIALCAMGYRFNSFYKDEMHPFVDAMVDFLTESGARGQRPGFLAPFYRRQEYKYQEDIEYMRKLSLELVQNRKDHPQPDKKDLLNAMINGRDAKTGEGLSDENIVSNMITFLIAGHETTSGLLSFAFYYLAKNPEYYRKAQEEVDAVVGDSPITVDHMTKLPYLNAILRETLRLQPTAPGFTVEPKQDEVIGGKYFVPKGAPLQAILPKIHRDPAVYGEDANEFKPERMLDENFSKLPPNAWKPFGNGMRACIGRPFAWQEALLVAAMLLQYFNVAPDDPQYNLHIKQSLTIKPKEFYMRATLRNDLTPHSWSALCRQE
ncbi:hypothetical protein H2203_003185 [Taxawa tesnikishii (nom. ined.)]|nr:hypothetical protein H2203_003185 [Dothideales sp. JES 119]